jgi:glycosyltransferase involved in cell wall biosynthesis
MRFQAYMKSTQQLRVLIVTSIHPDFDARVWKHARSLAAAGCQVQLICPWRVRDGEIRDGVHLKPFPRVTQRLLRPFLIPLRLGRRLLPALRDADIVHFHDIDLLPCMALVSMFRPVVYDVHENYPDEMLARDWIPRILRKPLYHIVAFAESLLARIVRNCVLVVPAQDSRFGAKRLRIIHVRNYATRELLNGVRDDYFSRKDVIVFTGGHHTYNGSLLLLDIAARTRARNLDLTFLMTDRFADENFRRRFLDEIDRLGLGGRVIIRPYVAPHDIMSLLNQGTVALSPNLRVRTQEKAIPTKLFEYMAARLPIVASDLPNQLHFVGEANAGLLARPEEPETFVDALTRLVSDRAYAHQLGLNGQRAFIERYCWETQIPSLLGFYETIRTNCTGGPGKESVFMRGSGR